MKFTIGPLALARLAACAASLDLSATSSSAGLAQTNNANIAVVPNTFIIELEPGESSGLFATHQLARIMDASTYEVRHEYHSKYFYGLSATFQDTVTIQDLQGQPGVKNVWTVPQIPRPRLIPNSDRQRTGTGAFGAGITDDTTVVSNYRGNSKVNNPLVMGNVEQLHKEGVKGKGIQIALIDSGVDYNHPSLGGGFGSGFKVAMGYDFVGDDYDGSNSPVPDDDPFDPCSDGGHGTHCAGIIGMQDAAGQGFGLVGVAPEATIAAYRVFSCLGGSSADIILDAIQRAADDGADVISMSLGIPDFWEVTNPFESIVSQLADDGILVVAAIGNDGRLGPYGTSAPGLSTAALSVGSIENDVFPTSYTAHDEQDGEIAYLSVFPLPVPEDTVFGTFKLGTGYEGPPPIAGFMCSNEAWQAAADADLNWNETVILAPLDPRCGYYTIYDMVDQLGLKYAILYIENEEDIDQIEVSLPVDTIQLLFLDYANSQKLLQAVDEQGDQYTLTFDDRRNSGLPNPLARTASSFSSFGPSVEMTLNPKLSAPGGKILSTFPLALGGYAVLSGTSMATPFAAAAYALLRSQHPDLSVESLLEILQSTGGFVKEPNSDLVSSAARQGSGLINIGAAVKTKTIISPSELNLRDSAKPAVQTITIENQSKQTKVYSIQHVPAAFHRVYNNYLAGNESDFIFDNSVRPLPVFATAEISQSSVSLGPGESAEIKVQFTAPLEKHPYSSPVYSGFMAISDGVKYQYSIPYIGVPFDQYEAGPIAKNLTDALVYNTPAVLSFNTSNYLLSLAQATAPNIDRYHWPRSANDTQKVPLLRVDILLASRLSRIDLVPANISFTPDLYGYDPSIKLKYRPSSTPLYNGLLDVPTHGIIYEAGVGNLSSIINPAPMRELFQYPQFLSLVLSKTVFDEDYNPITITSGDYRPLVRAARFGGDLTNPDDYESWLGPVIRASV